MTDKYKYKLEKWKKTNWKSTKRETVITVNKLVKRYPKNTVIDGKQMGGKFVKNAPIINKIQEKSYGTGYYRVGLVGDTIVTRQKIADRIPQWYDRRKEVLSGNLYRCSITLDDIPYVGDNYYGFKIIAFSRNKNILSKIYRDKMKKRLIQFIERCLGYRDDEFWFDMYFGYEDIGISNATGNDNNKYYLIQQKRHGSHVREEQHNIGDLL